MGISKFLDPKNDIAFKKVFGSEKHKDILIHFINDILGLTNGDQIEEVEFLSPIQDPDIASKKQSIVDVLCRDRNGVQVIIEMQVAPTIGFEKRAQYYVAKAYSRQLDSGREHKYQDLKKVIFIAIADCIIFPDKAGYKSQHVLMDDESYERDLQGFSFTFVELPKFKKSRIEELENIVEKWCYYFKYAAQTSEADIEKIIGSDMVIKQAYEALNQFNWSEPELIAYEGEIKRIMDNQAAIDYKLHAAEAKGMEKGREEGIAEGMEKGREEGIAAGMEKGMEKEKYLIAEKMLAAGAEADFVASVTGLSIDTIRKLQEN